MKKVIITSVVSLTIIAIIITAVFVVVHNRTNKILCDNQNQVDVLSKMYEEFINDSIDTDENNVELSNSTLRNFVTKEAFEDEQIEKLREVERNFENAQNDYVLTLKYNSRDKIIILNISSKSSTHMVEQEYLLKVQNGKIEIEHSDFKDYQGVSTFCKRSAKALLFLLYIHKKATISRDFLLH